MRRAPQGHPRLIGAALGLAVAAAGVGACGGGGAPGWSTGLGGNGTGSGGTGGTSGASGTTSAPVTYYKDVRPIVEQHCASCHTDGGIAPFAFTSYDDTKGYAALMAGATQSGQMPPWMPADGCGDFRDVRRLSPRDVSTLQAWRDQGAPAGDPADAPAPPGPTGPDLGTPGARLDPGVSYQPNGALTDDYHCFLIDPGLAATRDLVGFDVHPGTAAAVHHVLLFSVAPDKLAAVMAKDAAEAGTGWTCFGGTGVDGTPTIGGWVPGSGASAFPPPTGIRLAAGTQIVMQVHYNLLTQKQVSDRTTADLFYAASPVSRPAAIAAVANTRFLIPAGTASQTVTADLPIDRAWALWGVVPHMHLHGTQIKVEIRHPDGSSGCAVDIPKWDFHWQQFYYYQQPIPVAAGDVIRLSCTFDNSPARQPVIDGVKQPPMNLTWGERTIDEMCLNYLFFTGP